MKRRSVTTAMKVRIFDAAKGICHICGLPIDATRGEKWQAEHVIPLWNGGKDDESNMRPAHVDCHAGKTKEEAPVRAKGTRQRAKHIGAVTPKQKLQSRGFEKVEKPRRIDRNALPKLPPRPMFVDG